MHAPKTKRTGIHTARTINKVSSVFFFVVFSSNFTEENSPETYTKYKNFLCKFCEKFSFEENFEYEQYIGSENILGAY